MTVLLSGGKGKAYSTDFTSDDTWHAIHEPIASKLSEVVNTFHLDRTFCRLVLQCVLAIPLFGVLPAFTFIVIIEIAWSILHSILCLHEAFETFIADPRVNEHHCDTSSTSCGCLTPWLVSILQRLFHLKIMATGKAFIHPQFVSFGAMDHAFRSYLVANPPSSALTPSDRVFMHETRAHPCHIIGMGIVNRMSREEVFTLCFRDWIMIEMKLRSIVTHKFGKLTWVPLCGGFVPFHSTSKLPRISRKSPENRSTLPTFRRSSKPDETVSDISSCGCDETSRLLTKGTVINEPRLWPIDLNYHFSEHAIDVAEGNSDIYSFLSSKANIPMNRNHPLWRVYIVQPYLSDPRQKENWQLRCGLDPGSIPDEEPSGISCIILVANHSLGDGPAFINAMARHMLKTPGINSINVHPSLWEKIFFMTVIAIKTFLRLIPLIFFWVVWLPEPPALLGRIVNSHKSKFFAHDTSFGAMRQRGTVEESVWKIEAANRSLATNITHKHVLMNRSLPSGDRVYCPPTWMKLSDLRQLADEIAPVIGGVRPSVNDLMLYGLTCAVSMLRQGRLLEGCKLVRIDRLNRQGNTNISSLSCCEESSKRKTSSVPLRKITKALDAIWNSRNKGYFQRYAGDFADYLQILIPINTRLGNSTYNQLDNVTSMGAIRLPLFTATVKQCIRDGAEIFQETASVNIGTVCSDNETSPLQQHWGVFSDPSPERMFAVLRHLKAIVTEMHNLKQSDYKFSNHTTADIITRILPGIALNFVIMRLTSRFQIVATNVRCSETPLYLKNGQRIFGMLSWAPSHGRSTLSVEFFSHENKIGYCVSLDRSEFKGSSNRINDDIIGPLARIFIDELRWISAYLKIGAECAADT